MELPIRMELERMWQDKSGDEKGLVARLESEVQQKELSDWMWAVNLSAVSSFIKLVCLE